MMFARLNKLAALVLGLAVVLLTAACETPRQPSDTLTRQWQPKKIAVVTFQKGVSDRPGAVRSPLTGAAFTPGPMIEGANLFLDESLNYNLPKATDLEIVPVVEAGRLFDRLRNQDLGLTLRDALMKTGQQVGADGVLIGFVYRFSQREGNDYAAEHPASAAFDLAMVRVKDGAVIWKNSFDETQRSLSDNLYAAGMYMERGVHWFTVEEFGDYGLQELLKRFPWQKEK
jgi:hypothetical protein